MFVNEIPGFKIIKKMGSATLEIYALQMTFGYDIANLVSRIVNNNFLANISTISIIIVISLLINYFYKKLLLYGKMFLIK